MWFILGSIWRPFGNILGPFMIIWLNNVQAFASTVDIYIQCIIGIDTALPGTQGAHTQPLGGRRGTPFGEQLSLPTKHSGIYCHVSLSTCTLLFTWDFADESFLAAFSSSVSNHEIFTRYNQNENSSSTQASCLTEASSRTCSSVSSIIRQFNNPSSIIR